MNFQIIPLSEAVICLNPKCEAISNSKSHHCPACGERGVMPLASMLDTLHDEENFHEHSSRLFES